MVTCAVDPPAVSSTFAVPSVVIDVPLWANRPTGVIQEMPAPTRSQRKFRAIRRSMCFASTVGSELFRPEPGISSAGEQENCIACKNASAEVSYGNGVHIVSCWSATRMQPPPGAAARLDAFGIQFSGDLLKGQS